MFYVNTSNHLYSKYRTQDYLQWEAEEEAVAGALCPWSLLVCFLSKERGAEEWKSLTCVENSKCCLCCSSKSSCAALLRSARVEAGRGAAEAAWLGGSRGTAGMPGAGRWAQEQCSLSWKSVPRSWNERPGWSPSEQCALMNARVHVLWEAYHRAVQQQIKFKGFHVSSLRGWIWNTSRKYSNGWIFYSAGERSSL